MKKFKKGLFIALILLTIGFIWSNSLKPAEDSMDQSNFIKELIIDFFRLFGLNIEHTFFIEFIRKYAHFSEFAVLGTELVLFKNIYYKNSKKATLVFVFIGIFVAFIDESIQLIPTLNRSGQLLDLCIDGLGIVIAFILFCRLFNNEN